MHECHHRLIRQLVRLPLLAGCLGAWPAIAAAQAAPAASHAPLPAQQAGTDLSPGGQQPVGSAALKYFGYAVVDCGWNDPLDSTAKTNYTAETAAFSNIGQLCVYSPSDRIVNRLRLMSAHRMKAFLSLQGIFFAGAPDPGTGSGMRFKLYPDYLARWQAFVATNSGADVSAIGAFYIADEPVWNGISASELKTVSDLLKSAFPAIPTAVIEAFPVIDQLEVPVSLDWIGFDAYGIQDPLNDPVYRDYLARLKSRMTSASQRVLIVMDGKWMPSYGHPPSAMAQVARSYFDLANTDPAVVGILGYLWPGGLDGPEQLGTRELPQNVRDEHARIGKLVTGK